MTQAIIIPLLSLLLGGLLTAAETDADGAAAKKFVQTNVETVLAILKNEKYSKEEQKEKVVEIADAMFDLPLMAKLALGRKYWPKFSEEERERFTALFVKTLKSSYADKIDLITDETVEFEEPVLKSKGKYEMTTNVVSKDKRYKMIYKITERKEGWKIYDVEIEGISIVRSYGSQYDQFLNGHPIPALLEKMEKKAFEQPAELENKEQSLKKGRADMKEGGTRGG